MPPEETFVETQFTAFEF